MSMKGNRKSSGATETTKECHGKFNWIYSRAIALMSNVHKRKVRKALQINRLKILNETVLNKIKVLNRQWWLRHHKQVETGGSWLSEILLVNNLYLVCHRLVLEPFK